MITRQFDKEREDAARKVIAASVKAAEWTEMPQPFHSGDEIGFDLGDDTVRATVLFNSDALYVLMTSPVQCGCHDTRRLRQRSLLSRNGMRTTSLTVDGTDEGAATPRCMEMAMDMLTRLYCDLAMVRSVSSRLQAKACGYEDFHRGFEMEEDGRIAQVNSDIREYSRQSGALKREFKAGGMTQAEYVSRKRPIHDRIVRLMDSVGRRDPFEAYYAEELDLVRHARPAKEMVKNVIESLEEKERPDTVAGIYRV